MMAGVDLVAACEVGPDGTRPGLDVWLTEQQRLLKALALAVSDQYLSQPLTPQPMGLVSGGGAG